MNRWKHLYKRELRRILTDKRLGPILMAGPLMYVTVFGFVYWDGRTQHVPIAIADQDHSQLSRDLTTSILASESFTLASRTNSADEIRAEITSGKAFVGLVIPRGFERDTRAGRQGRLVMILDGSSILVGNVVSRNLSGIAGTYQAAAYARRLTAAGDTRAAASIHAMPLQAVIRPLFNPTSNYTFFMLIGLACIALQQTTRMGAAVSLGLDSEPEARRELAAVSRDPRTVLTAKLAATATVILPIAYLAIHLPALAFGVPFRGNWLTVYLILLLFMPMQVLIGYGVAGIFRNAALSVQVLMFLSVPLFTVTGFTWSVYAMPAPWQAISWLLPLTHLTDMFRKIALAGTDIGALAPHLIPMLLWIPVAIAWGYWGVKKEIAGTGRE